MIITKSLTPTHPDDRLPDLGVFTSLAPPSNAKRYRAWRRVRDAFGAAPWLFSGCVRPVNKFNLAADTLLQRPRRASAAMTLPPAGPPDLLVVPNAKAQRPDKQRTGTAANSMPSSPQPSERRHNAGSPTARQQRGTDFATARKGRACRALKFAGEVIGGAALLFAALWPMWW